VSGNLIANEVPEPSINLLKEFNAHGGELVMPLTLRHIQRILAHSCRVD